MAFNDFKKNDLLINKHTGEIYIYKVYVNNALLCTNNNIMQAANLCEDDYEKYDGAKKAGEKDVKYISKKNICIA